MEKSPELTEADAELAEASIELSKAYQRYQAAILARIAIHEAERLN